MKEGTVERKTLWLWLGSALAAPVAQYMAGRPWPWILALTLGSGGIFLLGERAAAKGWQPGKAMALLELIPLTLLGGWILDSAGQSWPQAQKDWIIPLILLMLALCGAQPGLAANSRGGACLFWPVAAGILGLLLLGLGEVERENLYPTIPNLRGQELTVAVLPGLALLLPRKKGKNPWPLVLILSLGAGLAAVVTNGILGDNLCQSPAGAFYEMCRSIRLLGNTARLEPVAATLLTLGWYSLLALVLGAMGEMLRLLLPRAHGPLLWLAGAALWLARPLSRALDPLFFFLAGGIFWYLVPAVGGIRNRKKQTHPPKIP